MESFIIGLTFTVAVPVGCESKKTWSCLREDWQTASASLKPKFVGVPHR